MLSVGLKHFLRLPFRDGQEKKTTHATYSMRSHSDVSKPVARRETYRVSHKSKISSYINQEL